MCRNDSSTPANLLNVFIHNWFTAHLSTMLAIFPHSFTLPRAPSTGSNRFLSRHIRVTQLSRFPFRHSPPI